jgi:hypothetical protein
LQSRERGWRKSYWRLPKGPAKERLTFVVLRR